MPEEETQVTEPQAPVAETPELKAQAPQPEATAEPAPEKPKGKTEAEWQADLAKTNAELTRANARYESLLGNERKRASTEAVLARHGAILEAMVERMDNPEAEAGSLKNKVASITDETARRVADRHTREEWWGSIGKALTKAGMSGQEPELAEATRLWFEGDADKDKPDVKLLFQGFTEAQQVILDHVLSLVEKERESHKKELEEEKKRTNQAQGTLEVGIKGGLPGGVTVTPDNIDALWLQHENEHPDSLNPYDQQYRRFVAAGEL